jgi:DNA invertase Pin-like site-specific DNA recombinase
MAGCLLVAFCKIPQSNKSTNLRKERQLEGIAKAKAAGVYKGRPPTLDVEAIRALKADGKGATEIAKTLGVGRASVYRALGEDAKEAPQVR